MKITFEKDYIIETTEDYSPMRKNTFTKTKKEILDSYREISNLKDTKRKKLGLTRYENISLTKKERTITKTREYKKLFKKGDMFTSIKGVNIVVGDNGCGKSTLIKKITKSLPKGVKFLYVDLEKTNPKITKPDPENGITYSAQELVTQFMWNAESHGETREGVLMSILEYDFDMLILDEPEQGLSLKNQKKYINKLKAMGKEVLIITHSKVFIENVDSIFDVEKMKWVNSEKYLKNI